MANIRTKYSPPPHRSRRALASLGGLPYLITSSPPYLVASSPSYLITSSPSYFITSSTYPNITITQPSLTLLIFTRSIGSVSSDSVTLRWTFSPSFLKRMEELKRVFKQADLDGSGQIGRDELAAALDVKRPGGGDLLDFISKVPTPTQHLLHTSLRSLNNLSTPSQHPLNTLSSSNLLSLGFLVHLVVHLLVHLVVHLLVHLVGGGEGGTECCSRRTRPCLRCDRERRRRAAQLERIRGFLYERR